MKNKKKIIFILIIGILFIGLGIILALTNFQIKENNQKKENTLEEKETKELVNPNIEKNKNEAFKQEHCIENICIKELNVSNENEVGLAIVDGLLYNNSSEAIPKGYIKIEFNLNGEIYSKILRHQLIPANGETVLMWQHTNKELINATDYKLVKPTEAELAQINNS